MRYACLTFAAFTVLATTTRAQDSSSDGNPLCIDTCMNQTIAQLPAAAQQDCTGPSLGAGFPPCLCPSDVQTSLEACFASACSQDNATFGHDIVAAGCYSATETSPLPTQTPSASTNLVLGTFVSSAVAVVSLFVLV